MIDVEAQRTLVKSPPELWALLSDAESLGRQLAEFGEVRIVSSEAENSIAWEGEGVSGTIGLKASGWGTKVTMTATRQPPAPPEPVVEPEPEPVVEVQPQQTRAEAAEQPAEPERRGFFARLFRRRRAEQPLPPAQEPIEAASQPAPEPEPPAQEQPDIAAELRALEESSAAETRAALTAVLDRLGAAHHRPFSRA